MNQEKNQFLGIFAKTAKGSDEHHGTEKFPLDGFH
jgi:hypothetical protein